MKDNELSFDENEIHKLRSVTKGNETVMKVRRDSDLSYLTSDEEKEASECSKDEYFSGNLKPQNSHLCRVTMQRSSTADINEVPKNECQISEAMFSELCLVDHEMYESDEFKTLEDALMYFGLYSHLERLDISLDDVRRRRITKSEHEQCFTQLNKEIAKLSLIYHPDRAMRRGGTGNEIKTAEKLQAALNAVRTVLSYLNAEFLSDIRTDHQFRCYSKLCLRSLCNEKEVKCRIYEMKFKLCLISKIKQKAILQIRIFLIESKKCVSHYIQGEIDQFNKLCHFVLVQLNHCIESFMKLCIELEETKKRCKSQQDEHILYFVHSMTRDTNRDLRLLIMLEKSAKSAMKANLEFFSPEEFIDPYFVLPFVWYINVILMCKVMAKNESFWDIFRSRNFNLPKFNQFSELKILYCLTAYYCGDNMFGNIIKSILNNESFSEVCLITGKCKAEIASTFREILIDVNKNMEIRFNTDHYTEVTTADFLELEIVKCESMMEEFEKQKQDLSECIKEIRIKTEKMEEECNDAVQTSKDLNSKIDETLETKTKMFATLAASSSKIEELFNARKKSNENSQ